MTTTPESVEPSPASIVDLHDKVAFRDDLGSSVCWASIDDAYTEEAEANKAMFDAAYEYVKNGDDDWFHTDGDLYQGSTLMRVIRRKADGKLFGFTYWSGGGKYGEDMIEHNGDDHGFPSKYDWEDGVAADELWYVFLPIEYAPIPAYKIAEAE